MTRHTIAKLFACTGAVLTVFMVIVGVVGAKASTPLLTKPPTSTRLAAELQVCPSGCAFNSIQDAVDAAGAGDVILVATGVYTDVHARPRKDTETTGVVNQVVYIDKPLTLRGGYTATNFTAPPNPVLNPTVLDAQGRGRVLYMTSASDVTIEGFHLTGGDATGLRGGDLWSYDAGGGVYVISTTTVFRNNQVSFNTTMGTGGGLFVYQSTATLTANMITSNRTQGSAVLGCCPGGGLVLHNSVATLTGNTISNNVAQMVGGLEVQRSDVTLVDNTISNNRDGKRVSGVEIGSCPHATLIHNTIAGNGPLGGLTIGYTQLVLLIDNVITENAGRGLSIGATRGEAIGNTIADNTDGGVGLGGEVPILKGNIIRGNTGFRGGGLSIYNVTNAAPILINNLIANNQATDVGSGIYILASPVQLLHTTLVGNSGGDGSGIYITSTPGGVTLTNTTLVSHTTGITVASDSNVTLDSILWFNNGTDIGGGGVISVTHAITGDPRFAIDGYHILSGSAALDAGTEAYALSDIDNEPRSYKGPDLGADEYWPPGTLQHAYLPLLLKND